MAVVEHAAATTAINIVVKNLILICVCSEVWGELKTSLPPSESNALAN